MTIAGCHVFALLVYESFFVLSTDLTAAYAIHMLAVNSYQHCRIRIIVALDRLAPQIELLERLERFKRL
jgi:hypothetical protein